MTQQKSLKRRVRTRMAKTGERYTAARRQVLAKDTAPIEPATVEPAAAAPRSVVPEPVADAPVVRLTPVPEERNTDTTITLRTGRPWSEWFAILDAWGAADRSHTEIARWLVSEHRVGGWWSQEVTVGYERAIGRRKVGERTDGFSITVSRTVDAPIERLFAAFVDPMTRGEWLPEVALGLRTATAPRTARFDWTDGTSRLAIGFTAKGDQRSSVALQHERLPDAEAAARMRTFWRERFEVLQHVLRG